MPSISRRRMGCWKAARQRARSCWKAGEPSGTLSILVSLGSDYALTPRSACLAGAALLARCFCRVFVRPDARALTADRRIVAARWYFRPLHGHLVERVLAE